MKSKNNYEAYKNNLDSTFLKTFEKIEFFIMSDTKLTIAEKDSCLQQVLDDFLMAQENGVSITKITGENLSKYCANMVKSELTESNHLNRISITFLCGWLYIILMNLIMILAGGMEFSNQPNPLSVIEFSSYEVIMLLGFWILPLVQYFITKKFFYIPKKCKKIKQTVSLGIIIVTSLIATALNDFIPFRIPVTISQVFYISLLLITIALVIASITSRNTFSRNDFEKRTPRKSNMELLNDIYKKKYDFNLSDYEIGRHIDDKEVVFLAKRKKDALFKLTAFTLIFLGYIVMLFLILFLMFTKDFDIFITIIFIFSAILGLIIINVLALGFKEFSLLSKLLSGNK